MRSTTELIYLNERRQVNKKADCQTQSQMSTLVFYHETRFPFVII